MTTGGHQIEYLPNILNSINCGLIILDRDEKIIFWNHWIEQHSIISAQHALGKYFTEVFFEMSSSRVHEAIRNTLQLGYPSVISNVLNRAPFPLYSPYTLEKTAHAQHRIQQAIHISPILYPDNHRHCLIQITDVSASVMRERALEYQVSERKQTEKELNYFKTTLDMTMDCVFMFDPDTLKFFYVNQGAMAQVGYTYNELLNMRPYDIKPKFNEAAFREMIAPMLSGKQCSTNFETIHQHKNGSQIPVEIFLQYISPPGETPRFVAIVRDITERKKIDNLKSEFISTVSHELRTPLTSIRGSLGLLIGGALGTLPQDVKNLIDIANKNSERLLLLINDILDMEKIESGNMKFNYAVQPLLPLIQQALVINQAYVDQFEIRFELTTELNQVYVNVDADRLIQVLSNLISNAAKFSPAGSCVNLSMAHHANNIRVSVADQGQGIPEEFQHRIFHKFSQADASNTRQKGGTGLGLSISKSIIETMSGGIGFSSKTGAGTTFYFDLPEWDAPVANSNCAIK